MKALKTCLSKLASPRYLLALISLLVVCSEAHAGTSGLSGFTNIAQFMNDNINGSLGRVLSTASIIVGLVAGIVRQSFVVFIALPLSIINMEAVTAEIFSAAPGIESFSPILFLFS